ncbi:hypothetical protein ACSQ67_024638 [Phaseolus vulgaris]
MVSHLVASSGSASSLVHHYFNCSNSVDFGYLLLRVLLPPRRLRQGLDPIGRGEENHILSSAMFTDQTGLQ